MNEKVLKTLEFDKILNVLSSFARSGAGRELCLAVRPLASKDDIAAAQARVTDALKRLSLAPRPSYVGFRNILPSLRRLDVGAALSCRELLDIAAVLDISREAKDFLKTENEDEGEDSLSFFFDSLNPCPALSREIKRCVIGPEEVADDASAALRSIRNGMARTNGRLQSTLNSLVTSKSMETYLQDSVVTMRDGRYCIPVKLEHKNHVPGIVHDRSSSGATVFIEPMSVVKLNNELRELEKEEAEEIEAILSALSSSAAACRESLERDYNLLSRLDLILAKAEYSRAIGAAEPLLNLAGIINLKGARHPLLEAGSAVPIDVSLGEDCRMLIVTGPNTGGKTVSLKTVGLLTLMAQAGMHIPASCGSEMSIFDEVWADIGDEQSIEQNLSTFSSHMTNLVRILKEAKEQTLVLLDELCSGTDPTEGAALAQSILDEILFRGSLCMATTHYPELKVFAMNTPGVRNASCEFDVETLRPTYRLIMGLPGRSNAFEIAKRLGLENSVIEDAKTRIDSGSRAFEDLLSDIEIDRKNAERELERAREERRRAESLIEKYKKESSRLEEEKKRVLAEANEKACGILEEAKDYADKTIKDIRRLSKGADTSSLERVRSEAGERARASREKKAAASSGGLSAGKERKPLTKDTACVGMPVHIVSMNITGEITSLPDSRGNVGVQMGGMNMKVAVSDLETLSESEEALYESAKGGSAREKSRAASALKYEKALGVSGEIKLLGMNVDEALAELDKYIDDACMANLKTARIVHGKGTGALRSAVREKLKKDKRIRSFKEAEYGEGDAGVTVAEFR